MAADSVIPDDYAEELVTRFRAMIAGDIHPHLQVELRGLFAEAFESGWAAGEHEGYVNARGQE
jgi:hypothetical protein